MQNRVKIVETLPKPQPSPEPGIFDLPEFDMDSNIHWNDVEKTQIHREFRETLYNGFLLNSKFLYTNIKNLNISPHHFYFFIKIYSVCSNQGYLLHLIEKFFEMT